MAEHVQAGSAAGGDLSGTYPSPTVAKVNGVAVSGAPTGSGKVLTSTGTAAADWETPASGVALDGTATDIVMNGVQAAGAVGKAADAGHVHPSDTSRLGATAAAGGDLAGNYPNPTLAATAVTPGSYTSANITVDSKGRVTAAADGTGGGNPSLVTKTGAYTLTSSDYTVLGDCTSAAFALTLPTAVGATGQVYFIKKIDSSLGNLLTIATTSGQTIDGLSTWILYQRDTSLMVQSDGANWRVLDYQSLDIEGYKPMGATLNRWVSTPQFGQAATTATIVSDNLYALPFWVDRVTSFDTIGVEVTSLGSGSAVHLGIYADNGNMYPGALVVDSGSIATTGTGVKSASISVTLQPGMYWLAVVCSATAPVIRGLGVNGPAVTLGYSGTGFAAQGAGWKVSFTFAALPDPFTASGSVITGAPFPIVAVRVSG